MGTCFFCGSSINQGDFDGRGYITGDTIAGPHRFYQCPQCGEYKLYQSAEKLAAKEKKIITGYLLETKNNRGPFFEIDVPMVKNISNSPLIPKSSSDKILKLLLYIDNNNKYFGEPIPIPLASFYSDNYQERENLLTVLREEYFINTNVNNTENPSASLKMKGLEYIKDHKKSQKIEQCLVAMWFDPSMDVLWDQIIKPGCEFAGYDPRRVSDRNFNGDIVDEIIAGIRESRFLVADLTGYRGGVYYEAGFAAGLGKEVILLCREDWLDGNPKKNMKVHFDVSHINIIKWKIGEEAKKREELTNRIRATIGKGSYKEDRQNIVS